MQGRDASAKRHNIIARQCRHARLTHDGDGRQVRMLPRDLREGRVPRCARARGRVGAGEVGGRGRRVDDGRFDRTCLVSCMLSARHLVQ